MAHTTSNEDIRDDLIRRRVEINRFAAGLAGRMRAILNRAEPELRARLKARLARAGLLNADPGPGTTRRLIAISKLIKELNGPTFDDIDALVRTELVKFAQAEAVANAVTIAGDLPLLVALSVPDARALRSIVFARPFENRILRDWLSTYELNDRRRFMDEIRQGVLFNETPTQISRRIFGTSELGGADGARQITRRGALTLANTSTAAIFNGVLQAIYGANKKIVKEEQYVATLDSRTTPICRSLDGKRFPRGKGPKPPLHLNCRSVRVPVIDGRKISGRPANATTEAELRGLTGPARRRRVAQLVGQVPGDVTYQQWLTRQTVGFQNEVLGPTRGVLFRNGGLTLDSFVDRSGNQYTLRQLYEREAAAFQAAGIPAPKP